MIVPFFQDEINITLTRCCGAPKRCGPMGRGLVSLLGNPVLHIQVPRVGASDFKKCVKQVYVDQIAMLAVALW